MIIISVFLIVKNMHLFYTDQTFIDLFNEFFQLSFSLIKKLHLKMTMNLGLMHYCKMSETSYIYDLFFSTSSLYKNGLGF